MIVQCCTEFFILMKMIPRRGIPGIVIRGFSEKKKQFFGGFLRFFSGKIVKQFFFWRNIFFGFLWKKYCFWKKIDFFWEKQNFFNFSSKNTGV